jgi:voltage-gated potassium channel
MAKPHNEWRHLALLSSILFLFVITPVVAAFRHGVLIMNAVAAVVLVAGTYTLSERKRLFAVAVCLSGISIVAAWLVLITQQPWAAILSHSCVIVLVTFFSVTILGYVLRGTRITLDKIFAAVSVYLLIGYAWTFAYALIDELQPGSFVFLTTAPLNSYVARVLEMRYLSFMTLTTVGYGDVVPHSDTARTLAALEAVAGQIYLTVLIARLVGLHIVHAHATSSQKD